MRIGPVLTHAGEALFEGMLIALMVVVLIAGTAFAAKGTGGGGHNKPSGGSTSGGTISLANPLVVDKNGNGLPNWGDTVTFDISTTATTQPYVNLVCSGTGVSYSSWRGYFDGSLDSNWDFVLGSGGWTSGAADCTAWLGMYTKSGYQRLASTGFHVDP
jgi:hypothetical protein